MIACDLASSRECVESEPQAVAFHTPGEVAGLARLLVEVAENPERLERMSAQALLLARRFTCTNVAGLTLSRAYSDEA